MGVHRIHWVDAGSGPVVVLVHGSPVSSASFRAQIPALSERFRVLAPDLLGFGRSSGPSDGANFQLQAEVFGQWLDGVVPDEPIRLVAHDWGGPVSVGAMARRVSRLYQLVLVNTTVFADFRAPAYWRPLVQGRVGDFLVARTGGVRRALPVLLKAARTQEVRSHYGALLDRPATRQAVLALERLEGFAPLMEEVARAHFDAETLLLWGRPDPYFRDEERTRLSKRFPSARVQLLEGAGHFPQEDAPEAFLDALLAFLR